MGCRKGVREGGERDKDIKAQKRNTWEALKRWIKSRRFGDREELKKRRNRLIVIYAPRE